MIHRKTKPEQTPQYKRALTGEQQVVTQQFLDWNKDDARLADQDRRKERGLNPPRHEYVRAVLAAVTARAEERRTISEMDTQPLDQEQLAMSGLRAQVAAETRREVAAAPTEKPHYMSNDFDLRGNDFTQFR